MKKVFIYLFAMMAVASFTSCGNEDEPVNKQTFTSVINCRAIDGDQVVFSQDNANVELNYTDMTIKFDAGYTDANGHTATITTPQMKLVGVSSTTIYKFQATASQQTGSVNVESLGGYIDFATGMMWYTVHASSGEVVCTTQLLYAYVTTSITNPGNDQKGNHQQSAYLFALDSKGEICTMKVSNFMSTLSGAVDVPEVQYNGLTVTPTVDGYKIVADEALSNYNGFYTLTDVDFTLNEQCMTINGTFKCNGLEYKVSGPLYINTSSN